MKTARRALLLSWILTNLLPALAYGNATIVIVRHGEKPAQGLGQLACRGLNRSLALAPLLLSRYGSPVAIYAPNPALEKDDDGIAYAYIRPLATIEPLAIRSGLPVILEWKMSDIEPLAEHLLTVQEGTQVVAWEHHWAELLAKRLYARLGGNPGEIPQWQENDFDSIFVIRVAADSKGTRRVTFVHDHEGLNGRPEACPEGLAPASLGSGN